MATTRSQRGFEHVSGSRARIHTAPLLGPGPSVRLMFMSLARRLWRRRSVIVNAVRRRSVRYTFAACELSLCRYQLAAEISNLSRGLELINRMSRLKRGVRIRKRATTLTSTN